MNILSFPSCSFTPHRIISRAHHSLQNIPLQNAATRVELILIPDGAWSAVTGMGEAVLCVVQLRLVPSFQGSLYSKDTWKSRLPFLRMETVPIITDSCEVKRRLRVEGVCAQWGGAKSRRLEISVYNVNSADLRKDMRGPARQLWPRVQAT